MNKPREEVAVDDRWNVEALYPSFESWRKEFNAVAPAQIPRFPEFENFKNTLGNSAVQLKKFLDHFFEIDRKLSKLYTFAHLKHDEDITENTAKVAYVEALAAIHSFQEEISWFEPELLALPDEKIKAYLKDHTLSEYRFYLEKIFRLKPYTLNAEQERLMALTAKALSSTHKAFSAINDADFKFGLVTDKEGKTHELTHAKYSFFLRSHDRTLRKSTFTTYHEKFKNFENTLCELLNGQIEAHVFNARARGFKSALEASLYPKNVTTQVYHALIEAVHDEIDALHRYMRIRSEVLKLKPLHLYDFQVPLVPDYDMKIPYEEGETLVIDSVKILGAEYQDALKQGLKIDRWVDRYENQNKRSGAYSSGCYDSMPYILMNYKNILRDTFTLSHEVGHSMHSYFSRKNQPYPYSGYSIFVAEVASTFNEELLMQAMLKTAKTREEKIFLITQKIEDIRGTLFRQTQFAEFELLLHTLAENNIPLTPQKLNEEYFKLNQFYYGQDVEHDPLIAIEWARIPHFYYNFYVFQYATGISAALSLAEQVTQGGAKEREAYLNFLKSGESLYPLDALKMAGVDMGTSIPVKQAIQKFRHLLDELEKLLDLKESEDLAVKTPKC